MASKYINEDVNQLTVKELKAGIQSLAKVANQRLRQLEKSGVAKSSPAYNYVERLFYDNERSKSESVRRNTFLTTTAKGEMKFQTAVSKMKQSDLRKEFTKLQDFLSAKTSTVSGTKTNITDNMKKYKEKVKEDYGVDLDEEEIGSFFDDALFKHFQIIYGSDELNGLMASASAHKLSSEEVNLILKESGFTRDTSFENAPPLSNYVGSMQNWKERSFEGAESDGESIFDTDGL